MTKRQVEIFTAGCDLCSSIVSLVKQLACDSCEVTVLDMQDTDTGQRARALGVRAVPAVVVDGTLLDCCRTRLDEDALRAAGIGAPISA